MCKKKIIFIFLLLISTILFAQEQISIPRIESMPNQPSPYVMRDWKQVAMGYDSLVFDFNPTGQYLPLIWRNMTTVNYPQHESFGLHTVVGTTSPYSSEAINALPAVISASLVGINKSNQNGQNWVLMCEEYFNKRPEENIYLNHPIAQSGDDWWYDTMPNIFFYQLYDLYPGTGDFEYQFTTVANQWLTAVDKMGGSMTPWKIPKMNYRAWSFSQMKPLTSGVVEPEAAGAIAWILYSAYNQTGNENYRIGAEWAMEYLNQLSSNPSYELQLPYGVYTAARMNAELNTTYNIEKMINWCFDHSPLRSWGAIIGTWGGYDVSGLIGEISGNDYAFMMNGFEQVGALVPLVRYDERFARAIAKWVLNVANASRLFYPNFLPPHKQDSDEWSSVYDPFSYIGHEAIRKEKYGISPYATGDAIDGGWGQTNLVLYGSSHVGILGGIIDTTDVPKILKLDVLKTDYFQQSAWPTFLLYNPYEIDHTVVLDSPVEMGQVDVYDALSNQFVNQNVSGQIPIHIPSDQAVLLVFVPAGGTISYSHDQLLVNNVVIDFNSGHFSGNYPPRIKSVAALTENTNIDSPVPIYCTAEDRDGDDVQYTWNTSDGQFLGNTSTLNWASSQTGLFNVICIVTDANGGSDTSSVSIRVIDNQPPQIANLTADPDIIDINEQTTLICQASDPDLDSLSFTWQSEYGVISEDESEILWTAPDTRGYYIVYCLVTDEHGSVTRDSIAVVVGHLVGDYPLNGNADDMSGFGNHGRVFGALPDSNRLGDINKAFYFDGSNDVISIPGHPTLNSQKAISLNLWIKREETAVKEEYVLSHGSWQNRLKISILANQKIRWTIKTSTGVLDLDSESILSPDVWYNICVLYGVNKADIYLNGKLDASKSWSGLIATTSLDFLIAQMLPGDQQYNFKGTIDNLKIYNRILSADEIKNIYDDLTHVFISEDMSGETLLNLKPFPNPFNSRIVIPYQSDSKQDIVIRIFNINGQCVRHFDNPQELSDGHSLIWDATDERGQALPSGLYFITLKAHEGIYNSKVLYIK